MPHDGFPIWLSLRVAATAMLVVIPLGLGLALLQARRRYPLQRLVDALILLPLVLPPSVVGFFLVIALGRRGPVGELLERWLDLRLLFTPGGAVLASAIVALPILVKTAQPALEAVPLDLERIGRSIGLSPRQVIFRITLRVAWRGILAGIVLAFARAMGEFGATLMVAGNIPGRTNTMPLAIYAAFERGDDATALGYVVVLTAVSLAVVIGSSWLSGDPEGRR
jgi:molybdate transport system permease protein